MARVPSRTRTERPDVSSANSKRLKNTVVTTLHVVRTSVRLSSSTVTRRRAIRTYQSGQERYFSLYYWRQHCEKKCRYMNDIDHGPPRKSKNSLLTVSQGDDRATDGQARQTNKRKISGIKPPKGGKKTQKSRRRSPSPPSAPSPTFIHSFTPLERASSPEEDQFVTSRRPSAASIMPEGDEDTSTRLPSAYPAYLENLDHPPPLSNGSAPFTPASIHVHDHPQQPAHHMFSIPQDEQHASYAPYNSGVGHYPHPHAAYPGPPLGSTYRYDSRVTPYGSLPSYDPNTALPAFVSGPPVHEAHVIFNLDPFQTRGIPPQTAVISPTAPVQTTLPSGYEPPVSVQSVVIQQSTPIFQRVVDDKAGTLMNISAPQTTFYRPSSCGRGFTQEGDVFEICTAPHGNEIYHYPSSGQAME